MTTVIHTYLVLVLVLVFDDDGDQSEDGYEDLYTTVKRVQEIIDRKSVEPSKDDCGKLSETLSKLVETCPGSRLMRLWSEDPRVCAVTFVGIYTTSVKFNVETVSAEHFLSLRRR